MQNTRRKEGKVMLKPTVKASEFKKYGFKRCKGTLKESECYYLCIARGCKMIKKEILKYMKERKKDNG